MPITSALEAFEHLGSGQFPVDNKCFYPENQALFYSENQALGPVADSISLLPRADIQVIPGCEGEA